MVCWFVFTWFLQGEDQSNSAKPSVDQTHKLLIINVLHIIPRLSRAEAKVFTSAFSL